jgi:hypothetical protein
MKVYLAGPITGLTWEECTVWRNKVVAELKLFDIQCFSPLTQILAILSIFMELSRTILKSSKKRLSPLLMAHLPAAGRDFKRGKRRFLGFSRTLF